MPLEEFFTRRATGWQDSKGHRWVKKSKGPNPNIPLYSLWGDQKLSYLEARRRIYCTIYAALVVQTDAYKRLEAMLAMGENVQLLGYDGYNRGNKTLLECFNDTSRPFGHEQVLECLLLGEKPWEQVPEESTNKVSSTNTLEAKC
jgi:hypothetical protein